MITYYLVTMEGRHFPSNFSPWAKEEGQDRRCSSVNGLTPGGEQKPEKHGIFTEYDIFDVPSAKLDRAFLLVI